MTFRFPFHLSYCLIRFSLFYLNKQRYPYHSSRPMVSVLTEALRSLTGEADLYAGACCWKHAHPHPLGHTALSLNQLL